MMAETEERQEAFFDILTFDNLLSLFSTTHRMSVDGKKREGDSAKRFISSRFQGAVSQQER
jgi:hypothetical protein